MTNQEIQNLLDTAVTELHGTTVGYHGRSPAWYANKTTRWYKGLRLIADAQAALEPDPPPPLPPSVGGKLAFRPPTLENPLAVTIPNSGSAPVAFDGGGRDILVNPGFQRAISFGNNHAVQIRNARNVIIRGGKITIAFPTSDDGSKRHAFEFSNITGHVFVEGVLVDGYPLRSYIMGEGIAGATFTYQNCRTEGTYYTRARLGGGADTQHSDVWMTWGRGFTLRVDKMTAEYDNTGLAYYSGSPNRSDLRRVNLRSNHRSSQHYIWITERVQRATALDCWVETGFWGPGPNDRRKLNDGWGQLNDYVNGGYIFSPYRLTNLSGTQSVLVNNLSEHQALQATGNPIGGQQGDYMEKPTEPSMAGEIWRYGVPPAGDFVPGGAAGPGYVSPGYL